jgi:bacterial/archaeal transporter family protein
MSENCHIKRLVISQKAMQYQHQHDFERKLSAPMSTAILSILSGLGGMFGWGIYDFFAGVYSKKIGPFKTLFWSQLAGLVFSLFLILVFTINHHISLLIIILLPVSAACYCAGYLFFLRGFEIGNISIVAATMNLWAVFTMLIAFIFMGQRLTPLQFTGALLIISGVTFTSFRFNEIKSSGSRFSIGVKETISGAFFFGVFWNLSEVITEEIGWVLTTLIVKVCVIMFLLLFALLLKREIGLTDATPRTKLMIVAMGILEAGAVAIVNFGLTIGDAILITPISSALTIITIAMAIIFLKEQVTRVQTIGIITAISGIIIMAF